MCCGFTVACFSPLVTLMSPSICIPTFLTVGALLGLCTNCCTPMIATTTLGLFVGAMAWQLGLSSLGPHAHIYLILVICVLFAMVFCATPLGPKVFERFLVPALGAWLLATGILGMFPALGGCGLERFVGEKPCTSDDHSPLVNLAVWFAFFVYGVVFQALCLKAVKESEAKKNPGGTLVASLLPGAVDADQGSLLPRQTDSQTDSRFHVLIAAMYAPDGTDQSHLSEDERKLVDCCRRDEFERDRVMWGGGLI
jgi:hypothetical protein